MGLAADGQGARVGFRLVMLSALGSEATWMTSWNLGLLATLNRDDLPGQLIHEFAYMFHWRWAARALFNLAPMVHMGLEGIQPGQSRSWFAGVGPNVGFSILPEGWLKIPVELSLTYRMPLTLYNTRTGFSTKSIRVEAHWIELAAGLAFM